MKVRIGLIAVLLVAALAALTGNAHAQTPTAGKLRFLHALAGGPAVDVFVDNVLAARKLEFSNATRYLNVASGDHTVIVTGTGTGTAPGGIALLSTKVTISPDKVNQLIVVSGTTSKPEVAVYPQDLGPIAAGKARVSAVHAITGGPAVDIVRGDGSPLIQGLKYGEVYGEFDIAASASELALVPSGSDLTAAVIKADLLGLDAGTHNTVVALGTLQSKPGPSFLVLTAPLDANLGTDVLVRFANVIADGKAVDIYVNDQLAVSGLNQGEASEHIALSTGDAKVEVRNSGDAASATAVATQTLKLDPSAMKAMTVTLSGEATQPTVTSFADNVSTLTTTKARISVINLLGGAATLTVGGKALVSNASATTAAAPGELDRGVYAFSVAIDDPKVNVSGNLTVNGGTISELILAGTADKPQVLLATTGLNEAPGSVPAATKPGEVVAAAPTPTATLAAAAPTAAPPAADQPTLVPTLVPTTRPVTVQGIFGTVITNEGVNLKLREYPRTDAKTLALVPSGSQVQVLGVKGPNAKTATPGPQGTKVATPTLVATARADIWVFVQWSAPDGGTVTGWTIAEYLDFVVNGKPVPRKDFSTILTFKQIPDDTFGTLESTSVTPVAADDKRTIGTVTTLPGTNAQLRRTPNFKGESLALVPSGGIVYILGKTDVPVKGEVGEPKSPVWFNVQFDTEGGTVIGWMSADFLKLSIKYNGKPVDIKDVPTVTEIIPGSIQGNTTQVAPPAAPGTIGTVINIEAGANLQLRRDPNKDAESLSLIPAGTSVEIVGRNGAGSWIQVNFNGQTGWVSANFLKITKNGKTFPIKDIKITNGEKDTFGTTTPTATPVGAG